MKVTVPWKNQNKQWWNQTCADIMEQFGLPGQRYVTEVTEDHMSFIFYNDHDALLCKLLISDKV